MTKKDRSQNFTTRHLRIVIFAISNLFTVITRQKTLKGIKNMGIGDRTALPDHLNEKHEIEENFKDDSQYSGWIGNIWKRWNKATKHWKAYGPRSPKGIAFSHFPPFILVRKWRNIPILLFSVKGVGVWRYESDGNPDYGSSSEPNDYLNNYPGYYLSRIQYWARWHFQIQWPLFICFHFIWKDNPIMGYLGSKRDADGLYWYPAFHIGVGWK